MWEALKDGHTWKKEAQVQSQDALKSHGFNKALKYKTVLKSVFYFECVHIAHACACVHECFPGVYSLRLLAYSNLLSDKSLSPAVHAKYAKVPV